MKQDLTDKIYKDVFDLTHLQIVFAGIGAELNTKFVDKNDEVHLIKELVK